VPRRGEVILFTAPKTWSSGRGQEQFVKRVIGVGGDHVVCCDRQHRLALNGRPLDEPYVYQEGNSQPAASDEAFDIRVPAGRLWLMGDHRSHSGDSLSVFERARDITQATVGVEAAAGRVLVVLIAGDPGRFSLLPVPPTYADLPDAAPPGR
jgi:signal peptidase I